MSTLPLYVDIGSLSVFHFRNICIQYINIVSRTILHLYIKRGCPSISIVNMNKVFPIYSPTAHGESLCIHLHIDKRSQLFYNYAWIEVHHLLCIYVQIGIFDLLYISLCMHGQMAGNSLHIPHLFTSDPLYIIHSCLGKESPSILLHMHRYTHINRDCPSVLDLYICIYLERETD